MERVRSVARRVTADRGFELVDVELKRAAGNQLVRLYVDKPGGIGLDDLQSVSEEVSAILDAEDPIEGHYTLEVSSPGSRPAAQGGGRLPALRRGSSRSSRATSRWTAAVTGRDASSPARTAS